MSLGWLFRTVKLSVGTIDSCSCVNTKLGLTMIVGADENTLLTSFSNMKKER